MVKTTTKKITKITKARTFQKQLQKSGINEEIAKNMASSVYNVKITALTPLKKIQKVSVQNKSEVPFYLSMYIQSKSNLANRWLSKHKGLLSPAQKKRYINAKKENKAVNNIVAMLTKL